MKKEKTELEKCLAGDYFNSADFESKQVNVTPTLCQ